MLGGDLGEQHQIAGGFDEHFALGGLKEEEPEETASGEDGAGDPEAIGDSGEGLPGVGGVLALFDGGGVFHRGVFGGGEPAEDCAAQDERAARAHHDDGASVVGGDDLDDLLGGRFCIFVGGLGFEGEGFA